MKELSIWNILTQLLYSSSSGLEFSPRDFPDFPSAQNGYTGLTNDVFIKQIHSHNDYWRERPLLTALSYGVQSVEADVWNFQSDYNPDDEIYVGHNLNRLSKDRTLDSLYLDPLYTMLEAHNPGDGDTVGGIAERLPSGVFETDIHATLYVFIDFKSEGRALFGKIEDKLARFKEKDWLSHYDTVTGQFIWRPLTVIGTGNTPLESVLAMKDRYIFFDGPLGDLSDERIDHNVSPIASGALRLLVGNAGMQGLSVGQLEKMVGIIRRAHEKGIKTRVWDTPWWPVSRERRVWRQLIDLGSDFLNADDLEMACRV